MSWTECDVRSSQKVWCQVITKSVMSGHQKKCDVRSSQKVWCQVITKSVMSGHHKKCDDLRRIFRNLEKNDILNDRLKWNQHRRVALSHGVLHASMGRILPAIQTLAEKTILQVKDAKISLIGGANELIWWRASYRHFYSWLISGASYRVAGQGKLKFNIEGKRV